MQTIKLTWNQAISKLAIRKEKPFKMDMEYPKYDFLPGIRFLALTNGVIIALLYLARYLVFKH